MKKGKIIKLTDRGFGFIREDGKPETDKGLFFHSQDVVGTTYNELHEGDVVTYDEVMAEKGPAAKSVTLA